MAFTKAQADQRFQELGFELNHQTAEWVHPSGVAGRQVRTPADFSKPDADAFRRVELRTLNPTTLPLQVLPQLDSALAALIGA